MKPTPQNKLNGLPNILTVPQFSAKVDTAYQELVRGGDPARAAEVATKAWFRLDPVETAQRLTETAPQLHGALGRMAVIAHEAAAPGPRKRLNTPVRRLGHEAQLDKASTALHVSGDLYKQSRPDLEHIAGQAGGERRRGHGDETLARMDALTARSMLLHMDAREMAERGAQDPVFRRAANTILRASLGGLIHDTVDYIADTHALYQGSGEGKASHIAGRLVETMYFGYRLVDAYKHDGLLKDTFPRFAFTREDMPRIGYTGLPRKFDVAVVDPLHPITSHFVQAKNSGNSAYDPRITVWRPQRDILADAGLVQGLFQTIVREDATSAETGSAWRSLVSYFGPIQSPVLTSN